MNAITTTSRDRSQPHDSSAVLRANGLGGASLAAFEWQRGCQAEAELDWLLKQGVAPRASASRVAMLRQMIAAAPAHAGDHVARGLRRGAAPEAAPAVGTLRMGS